MRKQPPDRLIISTIYGLGAALLLLGLLFGKPDAKRTNRIPKPVRMLTSALVLACALLLRRNEQRARRHDQAELVAAGMGSGFLGDLIMAEVIRLPEHVLFGMLAFGAGHTCYIRALLRQARASTQHAATARWGALSTAWLI